MKTIKKVSSMSVAKLVGAMYAFFGFIFGLIISIVSLLFQTEVEGPELFFGVGSIVIYPLMYGAMGWIGGFISGVVYNLIAKYVGGIRIELE